MISFEDFEHSKENIQPLRQGRKPEVLQKLFQPMEPTKLGLDLDGERLKFEHQIANCDDDQLLDRWQEYLAWTRQHFPMAGQQSRLVELYERCTRELMVSQLLQDPRYVQMWLDYAALVQNPLDIYRFLDHNGVGVQSAKLYVAWAMYLELCKRYPEVEALYHTAKQRGARPKELLQSHYENYAQENVKRLKEQFASMGSDLSDAPRVSDENQGLRAAFNPLQPDRDGLVPSHRPVWSPFAGGGQSSRGLSTAAAQPSGNPKALRIFQDSAPAPASSFAWTALPPERERRKENLRAPVRWPEATGPALEPRQKRAKPNALEVFEDEECAERPAASCVPHGVALRAFLDITATTKGPTASPSAFQPLTQ